MLQPVVDRIGLFCWKSWKEGKGGGKRKMHHLIFSHHFSIKSPILGTQKQGINLLTSLIYIVVS